MDGHICSACNGLIVIYSMHGNKLHERACVRVCALVLHWVYKRSGYNLMLPIVGTSLLLLLLPPPLPLHRHARVFFHT